MIYLDKQDLLILHSILQKYPYKFYAYGSRVKNTYKKFSDLDLCIMENISDDIFFEIQNALEESDISIKIDIKRWFVDMNAGFRSLIEKDITPLLLKN
ncbi:nucleotidyltransferase domain-containing protein [Rickettsia endosymbiont of Halotydeus destructor]|uniref:nucleotidyltransferase domain-containing protein n=1 Tax=Rickettsia endosymbiont of Halotydeus destructor TaxID=2996754 RepID=UPI003BAE5593